MTNLVELDSARIDADVVRVLELALSMAKRGDLFCGTGEAAGRFAGSLDTPVRITPLVPAAAPGNAP